MSANPTLRRFHVWGPPVACEGQQPVGAGLDIHWRVQGLHASGSGPTGVSCQHTRPLAFARDVYVSTVSLLDLACVCAPSQQEAERNRRVNASCSGFVLTARAKSVNESPVKCYIDLSKLSSDVTDVTVVS